MLRETLTGREIKTPTVLASHRRLPDFQAADRARRLRHRARRVGRRVVSNEYAVLNSDGQIDLRFLRYLSESRYFQQTCFHSSIGVHVEKMIFKTERWLKWPFNIPPLPDQRASSRCWTPRGAKMELIAAQIERLQGRRSRADGRPAHRQAPSPPCCRDHAP